MRDFAHNFFSRSFVIAALAVSCLLASCSIYESGGRKAIETNENGFLGLVNSSGYDAKISAYYACSVTKSEPEFLKEPLETVATPYDSDKFTTFVNSGASEVIVYTVDDKFSAGSGAPISVYGYCHITNFQAKPSAHLTKLSRKKIQYAAKLGVEQITLLLEQARP